MTQKQVAVTQVLINNSGQLYKNSRKKDKLFPFSHENAQEVDTKIDKEQFRYPLLTFISVTSGS